MHVFVRATIEFSSPFFMDIPNLCLGYDPNTKLITIQVSGGRIMEFKHMFIAAWGFRQGRGSWISLDMKQEEFIGVLVELRNYFWSHRRSLL
jgi:hypothetical protein